MKPYYKNLGKVSVTSNGYWSKDKQYERISIVTNKLTGRSYISKKDVPLGIDISNDDYWQPIASGGYKNNNIIIINDIDTVGNIKVFTLQEAVKSIAVEDRSPGLILGFYGKDNKDINTKNTWYLYQYKSVTINDWEDLSNWQSVYDNVSKFKGYFIDSVALSNEFPFPNIGDFAFVGKDLEHSVIYICIYKNIWEETINPALNFANKFDAVYFKDVKDTVVHKDETIADRAMRDSNGKIIHDTYIAKGDGKTFIESIVNNSIRENNLPNGVVTMNSLNDSVKKYFGSNGNITNNVDDEDLTIENDVIKFKNKYYDTINYSGIGKIYLRKYIVDGVNIFAQNNINKDNTRYIIQYDYCLNGKEITIPKGCILDLVDGGSLKNGTLICNNTIIVIPDSTKLDIELKGTYHLFSINVVNNKTIEEFKSKIDKLSNVITKCTKDEYDTIEKDDNKLYIII